MSLQEKFEDEKNKMEKFCEETDLGFIIDKDNFPIIFTISPTWQQKQISIVGEELINGTIRLIFGDELVIKIDNDFTIDDETLNKIKNMAKKIHYLYLQLWFKHKNERYNKTHKVISNDFNGWGLTYEHRSYRP